MKIGGIRFAYYSLLVITVLLQLNWLIDMFYQPPVRFAHLTDTDGRRKFAIATRGDKKINRFAILKMFMSVRHDAFSLAGRPGKKKLWSANCLRGSAAKIFNLIIPCSLLQGISLIRHLSFDIRHSKFICHS
jgi:hypothetical protein